MRRIFAAALLSFLAAGGASAATLDGVSFPETYPVEGQQLVLNGMGLRTLTVLNVRIYVAALYLEQRSQSAEAILASKTPKVVVLSFLHSGSKAEVEKEYRQGEENNCGHGECAQSDQADFEKLVAAAPAVAPGDTSTYIFTANGVEVLANNKPIGQFKNPDLGLRLLMGFIGSHPPSESLKSHLLGVTQG